MTWAVEWRIMLRPSGESAYTGVMSVHWAGTVAERSHKVSVPPAVTRAATTDLNFLPLSAFCRTAATSPCSGASTTCPSTRTSMFILLQAPCRAYGTKKGMGRLKNLPIFKKRAAFMQLSGGHRPCRHGLMPLLFYLVGTSRLELLTPSVSRKCSSHLSYAPTPRGEVLSSENHLASQQLFGDFFYFCLFRWLWTHCGPCA